MKPMNQPRYLRVGTGALMLLLLAACTSIDPVTGRNTYNFYTLDQDIQLGQSFLAQNTAEMEKANVPIDADPARVAQLRKIITRLAAVSDLPQLPYSVKLYQTNIVNAAAAPGGSMMVFEGLYDPEIGLVNPDDENELAAVMAHELAHVNCRHVTERLSKVQTVQGVATVGAIVAAQQDEDDLASVIAAVSVAGMALWIPSYTRTSEAEADRVGLFYMAKAGFDPRAAPRLWKRASEREGSKDKASIFATHPADKQRYDALMELLPYAMDEYARATGSYPADYVPTSNKPSSTSEFDWRNRPK